MYLGRYIGTEYAVLAGILRTAYGLAAPNLAADAPVSVVLVLVPQSKCFMRGVLLA